MAGEDWRKAAVAKPPTMPAASNATTATSPRQLMGAGYRVLWRAD